ncbi:MAG: MFS transporter [Candidatus Ranarchaeia archaeon]
MAFLLFTSGFLFYMFPLSILWLLLATIMFAGGIGLIFLTLNAYVIDLTTSQERGFITSTYQSITKLGQTIGPPFFTYSYTVTDAALATPFLLAADVTLVAIGVSVPMINHTRRTRQGLLERGVLHIKQDE